MSWWFQWGVHEISTDFVVVKCTPTISILGTELKLAETFRVDIKQLCQDLSLDIIKYMNPSATPDDLAGFGLEAPMSLASGYEDPGYWCPLTDSVECHQPVFQLEQDAPGSLVPAGMGVEVVEPQADNQDDQTSRLFPNALRISGLKHVCDNLCGSILAGLPQLLGCSRGICARTLGTQHIFCFESSCHHHQKKMLNVSWLSIHVYQGGQPFYHSCSHWILCCLRSHGESASSLCVSVNVPCRIATRFSNGLGNLWLVWDGRSCPLSAERLFD